MFVNPDRRFLYSAYKIVTQFVDDIGSTPISVQGTAFVIALGAGELAIVTNRHVIDADYKRLTPEYKYFKPASITITGRRDDDSLYRFSVDPTSPIHHSHSYSDDVAVLISPRCQVIENMSTMTLFYHFALEDLADDKFFMSELEPFDVVAFAGFPEEHDKLFERPVIRGGRVASDPRFDFSVGGKAAGRCIAYETFSREGSSGSPVFAPAKGFQGLPWARPGRLIGINAGHLNNQLGQHTKLSYFYRSTVILEILKENGVSIGTVA